MLPIVQVRFGHVQTISAVLRNVSIVAIVSVLPCQILRSETNNPRWAAWSPISWLTANEVPCARADEGSALRPGGGGPRGEAARRSAPALTRSRPAAAAQRCRASASAARTAVGLVPRPS
eukprot:3810155-Prymnesium_polylepis.2